MDELSDRVFVFLRMENNEFYHWDIDTSNMRTALMHVLEKGYDRATSTEDDSIDDALVDPKARVLYNNSRTIDLKRKRQVNSKDWRKPKPYSEMLTQLDFLFEVNPVQADYLEHNWNDHEEAIEDRVDIVTDAILRFSTEKASEDTLQTYKKQVEGLMVDRELRHEIDVISDEKIVYGLVQGPIIDVLFIQDIISKGYSDLKLNVDYIAFR